MAEIRLIDANKLKKAIKKSAITLPKYGSAIFLNNINDLIDNAPTLEERPCGEWVDGKWQTAMECNNCGCPCQQYVKHFCANCGADMRGNKETTFDDYLKEQLKDPEFRKEWDKLCDEEKKKGGAE